MKFEKLLPLKVNIYGFDHSKIKVNRICIGIREAPQSSG